jgi:hypothetical protein
MTQVATLRFSPFSYFTSDKVGVSFWQQTPTYMDGIRRLIRSEPLKLDAPSFVQVLLSEERPMTTGSVYVAAQLGDDLSAEVVLVAKTDTLNKRGRWCIRPEKTGALPPSYAFLAGGVRHGDWTPTGTS